MSNLILKDIEYIEANPQKISQEIAREIRRTEVWRTYKWKKFDRTQDEYMNGFIKLLIPLFEQQMEEVLRNLRDNPPPSNKILLFKTPIESLIATWLFGKKVWVKLFAKEGSKGIKYIVADYGQRTIDDIPAAVGISFNVNNPRVQDFIMDNGVYFGRETQKTTYEALKVSLTTGIKQGETIKELSSRVTNLYSDYIDGKKWKAERIARTEVIKASNKGAVEGYRQSGVVIGKEWLSTKDDRTRGLKEDDQYDHATMDGDRIKLDDKFIEPLSGEGLDYPGDPSGGAGNVINCYDEETEVLTEKGFIKFKNLNLIKEVRKNKAIDWSSLINKSYTWNSHEKSNNSIKLEKIATMNPDNPEEIKYLIPESYIVYLYDGKMITCYNDKIDFIVTPSHNMACIGEDYKKIYFKQADKLVGDELFYHQFGIEYEKDCNYQAMINRKDIRKISYYGFVYCVSMPKWHVICVRRHGNILWCGNCRCTILEIIEGEKI